MQHVTNTETRPGLRERKKQATRNAIAEAAVRLAAEHGAENVTVEAISEAAGVSPRTFFNYFSGHDDAFVMIDDEVGARIRQYVRSAPADRAPLDIVHAALSAELGAFEDRQELWALQAKVLQRSPHLVLRGINAHMADEQALARALMDWLTGAPASGTAAREPAGPGGGGPQGPPGQGGHDLDLYPRLLAAVAHTAVRVAVEHWCAHPEEHALVATFHEVFAQLAEGLPEPPENGRAQRGS
ncbi:TetR family transcriptional regulator [Streptomyces sp. NPDC007088]|uniref:TetR family transcriptional regulator n=1 Tax=Streptomyces sp. NPDC007088 TaxID=3364773 RepID=UPI0036B3A362